MMSYSYTENRPPYAHVICSCGRQYDPAEFYYCSS